MEKRMNEPKSLKSRLITGFKSYSLKINWFVFILICIFSWSGWIEVFAIWSELPLMINKLPEGWRLPGILNGIVQIGQVGSLLILIGRNYLPKMVTLKGVISVKLVISTILILVLSFYWDFTLLLWNEERSIALFSILFMFSLLGGSATLFFVPYISESFKKEYIIPYYIGETLFGVIPSVLAIVQGVGDDSTCVNVTNSDNVTTLEPTPMHPAFSISVYFIIIFAFLALSSVAFVLINCLDLNHDHSGDVEIPEVQNGNDESSNTLLNKLKQEKDDKEQSISTTRREKLVLFILNFLITFFYYGVLPGIQSYSTIPYGSRVFHLSINLGNLFLPVSIFLSVWSYNESVLRIFMEFLVAMSFTTYLIITSVMSPCPPFLDSIFGPVLTVACWIFSQTIFMRCRCIISTRLERFGERTLLISGSFTIIGEVFGGLILYFLIEHFRFFEEAPKCVFDLLSYCENI